MATHSSTLAWQIPWTEEPGGLQSMACMRDLFHAAHGLSSCGKWPPAYVGLAAR